MQLASTRASTPLLDERFQAEEKDPSAVNAIAPNWAGSVGIDGGTDRDGWGSGVCGPAGCACGPVAPNRQRAADSRRRARRRGGEAAGFEGMVGMLR